MHVGVVESGQQGLAVAIQFDQTGARRRELQHAVASPHSDDGIPPHCYAAVFDERMRPPLGSGAAGYFRRRGLDSGLPPTFAFQHRIDRPLTFTALRFIGRDGEMLSVKWWS